jgi:hypothetical protein
MLFMANVCQGRETAGLSAVANSIDGVAECKYDFPHPQPFSPRRRELESSSLARWERVRVRADLTIHIFVQQRPIDFSGAFLKKAP